MEATIVKVKTLKKVTYYSIQVEGRSRSEYDDFLERIFKIEDYRSELVKILQFIKDIGDKHGADKRHFRHEREAEALPPPYYHYIDPSGDGNSGLRLYCIRLTPYIVVLLNGDMKTNNDPEKCSNCNKHFKLANTISKKINDAIRDKTMRTHGTEIDLDDDFLIEFL